MFVFFFGHNDIRWMYVIIRIIIRSVSMLKLKKIAFIKRVK